MQTHQQLIMSLNDIIVLSASGVNLFRDLYCHSILPHNEGLELQILQETIAIVSLLGYLISRMIT